MLGIGDEMSVFLQAMLAGNTVVLVYMCIRIFRRLISHRMFFISLEDFFFWIWVGVYLFEKIYNTSDGSIRWFFTIGVVLGGICSFAALHFLDKISRKWRRGICGKEEKSIDKSIETR